MPRTTLHDALSRWIQDVIEMNQRTLDWSKKAYRLEPSNYTAGQLAYARVASAVARQLLNLNPKGFKFIEIRDDWLQIANYRGAGVKKRERSEAEIRDAIARSVEVQAAISRLAARFRSHKE